MKRETLHTPIAPTPGSIVSTLGPSDPAYPAGLRRDLAAPTLFVRGATPWGSARSMVAIVGARAASFPGVRLAKELAEGLSAAGTLIVSGGAIGIDAGAHAGAVACGVPTVCVLGSPVEEPYPARNAALFDEILTLGGALVSATPAGKAPLPGFFLQRNRYMALMVDAVVVVEAQARSGSLSTARAALAAGKVVGACPGTPGTDALLADGCALIERAGDVIAALLGRPRRWAPAEPALGTPEAAALAALRGTAPCTLEDVARRAGLESARAQAALALLELEGLAHATPTGAWLPTSVGREPSTPMPELRTRNQGP